MTRGCTVITALLVAGAHPARAERDVAAAVTATADPGDVPDDVTDAREVTRLTLRDQVMIEHEGATAAFSIDPTIAEASARDGRVTILARGIGTTTISVVTASGVVVYPLTVVRPTRWSATAEGARSSRSWTEWQGHFESSSARLTNSVELVDGDDDRTLRAYAVNVVRTDRDATATDLDARASLPALSLEYKTARRELVVFDKRIEHSPLTLDGITVRGVHLRAGGLEIHGGVASPVLYQNVFLPTQREVVLGASYTLRDGRSSWTPNVYAFPSTPQTGGTDGTMASLLYRFTSRDERLRVAAEAGWGSEVGAAGELAYQEDGHRLWVTARHQPRGFAALGLDRPLGSMYDALYTSAPVRWLTLTMASTAAHYEVGTHEQQVVTTVVDGRAQLASHVAVSLGASAGMFGTDTDDVRSLTLPVGLHLGGKHLRASALYRYQLNSARNRGGHGGRLGLAANGGTFHASAFVDGQQEAASVGFVLREEPLLAQTLAELGLTASTPDELARLLRELASLGQLGFLEDTRLELDPWRVQAAADVAWITAGQQLRLRVLASRTQGVTGARDMRTASLAYARRFAKGIEVSGMATVWSRADAMDGAATMWSIAAGMRVRLDTAPRLRSRTRRITGTVVNTAGDVPVAGVLVRLDGRDRTTRTDASGRFEIAGVAPGVHHVEAELPDDAYFVSASRVEVDGREPARFVIATSPARLNGALRDDTGAGIAGVLVTLEGEHRREQATTDSRGRYRFTVPPGAYELVPHTETLPVGYDASALVATPVRLARDVPVAHELVARAHRSVGGKVHGAATSVRIVELGRDAVVDDAGHYVFRQLAPGTYTVAAELDGATRTRTVEVPVAPIAIREVDFR